MNPLLEMLEAAVDNALRAESNATQAECNAAGCDTPYDHRKAHEAREKAEDARGTLLQALREAVKA